ncbi:MAG TPA: DUF3142 domain-containing protein [Pyrinomonadaceae bacterium]|jgi:hypothetical protein
MSARFFHSRFVLRLLAVSAGALAVAAFTAGWRWARAPRVWGPGEAPVAFWAWRAETPAQSDVDRAARETGARTLFLRAGQMDADSGRVARVRAVSGRMPRGVGLHLVYNATPRLLAEFGRVEESALAGAFAETFRADSERAERDGAKVVGLQLDVDVPTRLLPRYARVLRAVRTSLPEGVKLSVTGLPTWIGSGGLVEVLDAVDFWTPQFYGAEIPATADRVVPIASPERVARAVARVRELGKPFYAGLAAYGYALVYDARGRLVELRGDVDPARVVSDRNLELVGRGAFGAGVEGDGARDRGAPPPAGEWRYVFRAREDASLGGLSLRAGEQIVLDVPGGEALRAGVRGVREGAGDKLLGICLFRLPTAGDATTLRLAEVAAALADREPEVSTSLEAEALTSDGTESKGADGSSKKDSNRLLLTAENDGAGGALYGAGALSVTVRVPRGSVRGVTRLEGFDTFETLCEAAEGDPARAALRPCSAARAGVVRLGASAWRAGERARAGLSFEAPVPSRLAASVAVRREDGSVWESASELDVR